ncbi:MAG TPA: DUF2683 family protein [Candidatus Nanoarchaeia archaeon]|nr:DUF2683 family protein [Candidatus Nanoarchaeia archaeon]
MVQSIIDINENEDRVLNIVKAKYGLKNKSQAVSILVKVYEDNFLENSLKPEYINRLEKIKKGKYIKYNSIEELRKSTKK